MTKLLQLQIHIHYHNILVAKLNAFILIVFGPFLSLQLIIDITGASHASSFVDWYVDLHAGSIIDVFAVILLSDAIE